MDICSTILRFERAINVPARAGKKSRGALCSEFRLVRVLTGRWRGSWEGRGRKVEDTRFTAFVFEFRAI